MSSVLESEKAIDSCTQLFRETMRDFARQNSVVDLGLWINMYVNPGLDGYTWEHFHCQGPKLRSKLTS